MGYSFGLDKNDDGRSYLPVDIDNDGDLDLAYASLQGLRMYENLAEQLNNNYVKLTLKATKTQHHALGAEVWLTTENETQRDFVKITSGYKTQVPFELHFGLGKANQIKKLHIKWPSGTEQTFTNLKVAKKYQVIEGEKNLAVIPQQKWSERQKSNIGGLRNVEAMLWDTKKTREIFKEGKI